MPLDLAALLVEARAVSAEDVQRALRRQREAGGALDTALLELALLPEPELARFLSRASGLPLAEVTPGDRDARAGRMLPAGIAQRHRLAPFRLDGRRLSLLAAYPVDAAALSDLGVMLSMQLVPYVAPAWRVLELTEAVYGVPMPPREAQLAARLGGRGGSAAAATGDGPDRAPGAARGAGEAPPEGREASISGASAWRLTRADPEESLATAVAHAAETLDATEVLREVLDPEPVPEAPPRWTLAQASAALDAARDRDGVVAAALRYARDFLEAAAVFAVASDGIAGVDAVGWPRARRRCRAVRVGERDAGLFRVAVEARGPYLGPVAREPGNEHLLRALGRPWPAVALAYPIVVRDRVVCVLYGDNGDAPVSPRRVGDLLLFAGAVGAALERVLREAKAAHGAAPAARPADERGWRVHEPARAQDAAGGTAAAPPQDEPFRIVPAAGAVQAPRPPAGEETP